MDSNEVTPMMREWEAESKVYDVNYEYLVLRRNEAEQKGSDLEEAGRHVCNLCHVGKLYQRLGILFGIGLIENVQLLKLSKALCKVLLDDSVSSGNSGGDEERGDPKISWSDFEELFPLKAKNMKDPSVREYVDYEEVTFPSECFGNFFTLNTNLRNEDFHLPPEPTQEEFNKLAQAIAMNYYAKELRIKFRHGFRSVAGCDHFGRLFDAKDLQHTLSKAPHIDMQDWKRNTTYNGKDPNQLPLIKVFWESIKGLDQENRQAFCHFATGQHTPPIRGFKDFTPLFQIRVNTDGHGAPW